MNLGAKAQIYFTKLLQQSNLGEEIQIYLLSRLTILARIFKFLCIQTFAVVDSSAKFIRNHMDFKLLFVNENSWNTTVCLANLTNDIKWADPSYHMPAMLTNKPKNKTFSLIIRPLQCKSEWITGRENELESIQKSMNDEGHSFSRYFKLSCSRWCHQERAYTPVLSWN